MHHINLIKLCSAVKNLIKGCWGMRNGSEWNILMITVGYANNEHLFVLTPLNFIDITLI